MEGWIVYNVYKLMKALLVKGWVGTNMVMVMCYR